MQREMLEDTLIVGLDDSNHAAKTKGEIVVATFSRYLEDSLVKKYGKRANYSEAFEWLKNRDYKFTILKGKRYRSQHTNLPYAAQNLITIYIDSNNIKLNSLEIHLDGEINPHQESELRNYFMKKGIENTIIRNFVKRYRVHNCPKVIYMADIIANQLYQEYHRLLKDKNFIPNNL